MEAKTTKTQAELIEMANRLTHYLGTENYGLGLRDFEFYILENFGVRVKIIQSDLGDFLLEDFEIVDKHKYTFAMLKRG